MKRLILFGAALISPFRVYACLDCNNNGTDATFTGTITAQGFSGPTISTINERLDGAETVTIYDNATSQGNANTLTFGDGLSATCAAATCTVTNTSEVTFYRSYDLYVGTAGAVGVDVFVTSGSNFQLAQATVGLAGTNSTVSTVSATMFFNRGAYTLGGSTFPRNLTVVCADSATFVNTDGMQSLTIYGTVINCNFDGGGRNITSRWINLKTGARLDKWKIYNATGLSAGQGGAGGANGELTSFQWCHICVVDGSSDVIISNGLMKDVVAPTRVALYGTFTPLMFTHSSNVEVVGNYFWPSNSNTDSDFIFAKNSERIYIHDNYFNNITGRLLVADKGLADFFFENNQIVYSGAPTNGAIYISDQNSPGPYMSTGTFSISYNDWQFRVNGSFSTIFMTSSASSFNGGGRIKDNIIHSFRNTTLQDVTFATLDTKATGWVLQNNNFAGKTFISDSGTGTLYTDQNNTVFNVEQ